MLLVGLEDGLLPMRRDGAVEDLEEERRLAYVGMTRAKSRLIVTCARQRMVNGQRLTPAPSPFLAELPEDALAPGSGLPSRPPAPRPRALVFQPAPQTRPVAKAQPRPVHPDGWRPGLKVQHATFGRGVVLQVQGTGPQTRLVIYFDRAGRKTLLPSIARLDRV